MPEHFSWRKNRYFCDSGSQFDLIQIGGKIGEGAYLLHGEIWWGNVLGMIQHGYTLRGSGQFFEVFNGHVRTMRRSWEDCVDTYPLGLVCHDRAEVGQWEPVVLNLHWRDHIRTHFGAYRLGKTAIEAWGKFDPGKAQTWVDRMVFTVSKNTSGRVS